MILWKHSLPFWRFSINKLISTITVIVDKAVLVPAAHEDRFALTLDTFSLLLPSFETTLEVVTVPYCDSALAVCSLFYERALILDLYFFYYSLSFSEALLKLSFVDDSTSPFVNPHPCWLPMVESTLKIVSIRKILLSLTVFEKVLKVTFILLSFFC